MIGVVLIYNALGFDLVVFYCSKIRFEFLDFRLKTTTILNKSDFLLVSPQTDAIVVGENSVFVI